MVEMSAAMMVARTGAMTVAKRVYEKVAYSAGKLVGSWGLWGLMMAVRTAVMMVV